MTSRASGRLNPGTTRWLLIVALWLNLVALLVALLFAYNTTGGTLFLFTTVTPTLVLIAVVMLAGIFIHEYRHKHKLFNVERYDAGWTIFRQGERGDCAYFIRDGEIEVIREEDGAVVSRLGPGQYFGEMALIDNSPRTATVRAASAVELAVLGKRNFLDMMRLMPETEEAILGTLKERAMEVRSRASGPTDPSRKG
jgi:hypothetical protein